MERERLSDRNTFFTCDADERGSGLEKIFAYLRFMFAYSRLSSLNGRKMFEAPRLIPARRPWASDWLAGGAPLGSGIEPKIGDVRRESLNGEQFGVWVRRRGADGATETSRSPFLAKDAGRQRLWTLSSC